MHKKHKASLYRAQYWALIMVMSPYLELEMRKGQVLRLEQLQEWWLRHLRRRTGSDSESCSW
jgi:hypothetical protein